MYTSRSTLTRIPNDEAEAADACATASALLPLNMFSDPDIREAKAFHKNVTRQRIPSRDAGNRQTKCTIPRSPLPRPLRISPPCRVPPFRLVSPHRSHRAACMAPA
ncbi:hypothetical protein BCEP4_170036 [Burkholderia cepacia]|nr:hypothetical protein BCEP4_170036 [Burkholderia cepacia]